MPQRTGPDSSLRMIDAGRDRRIARILRALNEQPDPEGYVRQGTNGIETWMSVRNGQVPIKPTPPAVVEFLQSQTARSVHRLLSDASLRLGDVRQQGNTHVVESEDNQGRKTTYFIDDSASAVVRMQFVTGTATDAMSRKPMTLEDAYVFSDFRVVDGVLTAFSITRYRNNLKTEEMLLRSVKYNAGVDDAAFRP